MRIRLRWDVSLCVGPGGIRLLGREDGLGVRLRRSRILDASAVGAFFRSSARKVRGLRHAPSQARAATVMALTPVSRVGWVTGAKVGLWLTGMSWAMVPFLAAAAYRSVSMPPMPQ